MKNNNLVLSKEQVDSVVALYTSGKIEQAIVAIKALNNDYPNVPLLFNILGICYKDLDQLKASVKMFETAIAIKPDYAEAHNNLGITQMQLGQLDEAVESFKSALTIKPDYAEAHNNLGITLKELNQLDDAVKSYEKAIFIKPGYHEAYNNLGNILKALGRIDEAVKCYEQTLAIKPSFSQAHNNLGNALQELGQLNDALQSFMNALNNSPDFAEAHNNLGITQMQLGQLDEAVESFKSALTIKPDYAEAHNNLGITLKELNQLDDAVKSYEKAISIKSNFAEAHNNLGTLFKELGQLNTAAACYEKAIIVKPDYAYAHNNLGTLFKEIGKLNAAAACYEKAISIKPDYAEAFSNRGGVMAKLRRFEESLLSYEFACSLNPDIDLLLGNLLIIKMSLCDWGGLSNSLNELITKINNSLKATDPFSLLVLIDDPKIQMKAAELFVNKRFQKNHGLPKIGQYSKHKKIRIGYFSADFRDHPVSSLTVELYELHDRSQFEVYAFSFGPDTKDKMNLRIKAGVDHFYDVRKMSHIDIVALARSLELDIAIDLGGYTLNARSEIFALSAAPIQISYIGYLGTMGANHYDYIIADQTIIPEKNQKYYSEKIAYLPSYQVNNSKEEIPDTFFTRDDLGLPEDGFVFCCFNNTFKITPATFDSWARILSEVEGSVLLIYADNDTAKINLTKEIVARGIHSDRLIFGERLPKIEYMARYRAADLFLDTHPYNAGTTASDALRMGVPVLTFLGSSFASRMAASILNALNLPELVKGTQKEYESFAIELATDPEKFKDIKDKLDNNLSTAPLYDSPLFTRHLESAYTQMHKNFHQGLDPEHIYVEQAKN